MRATLLSFSRLPLFLLAVATLLLSACGGSSSSSDFAPPGTDCSLVQNQSSADCGALFLGVSDATGDFASYAVTVEQVTLVREDGVIVKALPAPVKMDFAQLVDASQMMATTYVPSGTYNSMSLTLDFSGADIEAEDASGGLVKLAPVNSSGAALGTVTVTVDLGIGNEIVIQHDVSTLASLDFDLEASNTVRLDATPPSVAVAPVLYATAGFTDLPAATVMGELVSVDASASTYAIDVQPLLYLGTKTFGSLTVSTSTGTAFEINGAPFTGADGLQAMASLPAATPTLAYGSFSGSNGTFEAEEVYAGSSVPGATLDAVDGAVLSRSGNLLTVRGVAYVHSTDTILYHSLVTVTLGSKTVVRKAGDPTTLLSLADISVGQRVALLGQFTSTDPTSLALDAGSLNKGYARLAPSLVSGLLLSTGSGTVTLDLSEINRHRVSWYDFTGTGATPADDADPAQYEVNTGSLDTSTFAVGAPVEVTGFVQPFGAAPPDFNAEDIGNYAASDTRLMVLWRPDGSTAPFSVFSSSEIVINLSDPNLGPVAVLRRGGDRVDLSALPSSPLIVPPANGLGTYAIRQNGVVTVYVSFASFTDDLKARLNGTTALGGFFANGGYNNGTFVATRVAAILK